MKILFVVPYVPSLIRVRPYHFIRELAQRHAVTVLATDGQRAAADLEQLRRMCTRVEFVPTRLSAAATSSAAAVFGGKPLQAAVCQSPELRERLRSLVASEHFDVVHVEHLRAADLVNDMRADQPKLFDAVDSISLLLQRTLRSSHSLRQRVIARLELSRTRRFEGSVLSRFDRAVVTAAEDADALCALAPAARVTVVPNGVDLDYFRPVVGQREPATIVLSGKMSYHANVTAALHFVRDIFPVVREQVSNARLMIVGSNPPSAIQALARDPSISVTGHVSDIREALGRATVAVSPMVVKVGIQNKVLEAMAMGLPVVCSAEGAAGLGAQPGRDFLVAETRHHFARAVSRLLVDAALRDELGRSGRAYVETHHRWAVAAQQVERLYGAAIDDHRARIPRGHA